MCASMANRSHLFRKTDRIETAFYRGGSREPKPIDRSVPSPASTITLDPASVRRAWLNTYWETQVAKEMAKT